MNEICRERLIIRPVTEDDLARYHHLCNVENWGIGFARIERMVRENPNRFWCGEIDGKAVSFCGCNQIDKDKAVFTSYVTDKEYRGQGIGRQVFDKVMSYFPKHSVFINSMENKISMYNRSGFTIPIYSTIDIIATRRPSLDFTTKTSTTRISIFTADSMPESILQYDNSISPVWRDISWFINSAEISLKAEADDGSIKGTLGPLGFEIH